MNDMKSKSIILLGCLLGILLVGWLVSNFIAPLSVEHGENVAFAKYMAQGLMPYQEFSMPETPVAIGILSGLFRMVGIEASSYWASGLLVLVHLLNGWLLWKLMMRVSVKKAFALFGLVIYLLLVYSTDGLMLNLEPFAVSFLLGACLLILQRGAKSLVAASLCYALAIGCKAQALALLPVLAVMVLWKGSKNEFRLEKGLLFVATTLGLVAAGYMGICSLSQEAAWTEGLFPMQEMGLLQTWKDVLLNKLVYVVIQGGRCGLFFLLALPWAWKHLSVHGKRCVYWAILAFCCYLGLFYFKVKVSHGMLVYPFVILALVHILQSLTNKYVVGALGVAVFIAPSLLSIREFQKLDMGQAKVEQQEELMALKEIIQKPGKALVQFGDCAEYELGPQILAEFPQLQPITSILDIKEADYIILTEEGFSELSYSRESDLLFECIGEMKSYGTGNYMVYVR